PDPSPPPPLFPYTTLFRSRPATLQLARKGPDTLGAQRVVRRRQIDQIAVMRDHCPDPARGERRAKRRDVGVPYHWLAPLVGRLREDLNRGRPDGIPPRGAQGYASLRRHVGPEQVVGCALFHVQGSSVNASREM